MAGFYSFVVNAKTPVGIERPMVLLDEGVQVFTAVVEDLDAFKQRLKDEGVEVRQVNRLDEHEAIEPYASLDGTPPDPTLALTNGASTPDPVGEG